MYHNDSNGYFTGVVAGFRVYYSRLEVEQEYSKQKRFCETDSQYAKFVYSKEELKRYFDL